MASASEEKVVSDSRLFLGFQVPSRVKRLLEPQVRAAWPNQKLLAADNWHLTMLFIGELPGALPEIQPWLTPLKAAFVPTVKITHLGKGRALAQIWLYVLPTRLLMNIRTELQWRIERSGVKINHHNAVEFVPHIKVANLPRRGERSLMADRAIIANWQPRWVTIFESLSVGGGRHYEVRGRIPIE